jgi:type IV pilus assembly protein PilQ
MLVLVLMLVVSFGTPTLIFGESPGGDNSPLVTATFFDSDLREALKEVALQTKVNIVADENVRGIITLDLKDVPLDKALRMMLIGEGLTAHKVDDFYVVGLPDPKNPAFTGLCDFGVYYFHNINIASAKALLPTFYEPYVKFDTDKDCANIIAPPELLKIIIDDFQKIDGERKQIKIKALVTEVRNDVLKEWGMNLLNVDFNGTGFWNSAGTDQRSTILDVANGTITGEGDASFGHFKATIQALVNDKKATIDADPELMVTEGKSGDLFVGEKRTLILYSKGTDATSSSTMDVEAGTTLKVTPKIVGDQIELTLSQKTSDFDDGSTDEITVKTREYNSVVRFRPGQTVLVAGLTEKDTSDNTLKTPILGDIPIVGLLFKQKSKLKSDQQYLIFLTAEVVKE